MTPDALADLHALCFTTPRPWRSAEFSSLLSDPSCFLTESITGFALGRVAGPEAEVLTIAVHPDARQTGEGGKLLQDLLGTAQQRGAVEAFLEVAGNNPAAIKLYENAGFIQVGLRKGYFHISSGPNLDALVMRLIFD